MESSIKLKESNNSNGNQQQQQQQSQSQPTSQLAATNPHALCNGNGSSHSNSSASNAAVSISICSSDSFGSIMPPPAAVAVVAGTATVAGGARDHELVSANSIELNAAASLSDDSGVPLTTNSSISSGDSYRIGMCKFEIEVST